MECVCLVVGGGGVEGRQSWVPGVSKNRGKCPAAWSTGGATAEGMLLGSREEERLKMLSTTK